MPEVTIQYSNPKTLKILKDLSKYFDFAVSSPKPPKKDEITIVNGVTMIRKTSSVAAIDNAEMNAIMERSNMDAKELRSRWQRKNNL